MAQNHIYGCGIVFVELDFLLVGFLLELSVKHSKY